MATTDVALLASRNGGTPWPLVALLLASAGALVVGRVLGNIHRAIVPAAVAIVAIAVALAVGPAYGGGPLQGPFAYRNATGTFYVQAAVAALMVVCAIRWMPLRVLGIVVAIAFGIAATKDSSTAGVSLLAIAVALIALRGARAARTSIAIAGALVLLVLAGTIALGAGYHPGDDDAIIRAVSERRVVLWRQSLRLIERHPGGVGPGRFKEVDRTAMRDPDASWAHNEFLQRGCGARMGGSRAPGARVRAGGSPACGCTPRPTSWSRSARRRSRRWGSTPASTTCCTSRPCRSRPPRSSGRPRPFRPGGPDVTMMSLARKASKAAVTPLGLPARRRPGDVVILLYHRVGPWRAPRSSWTPDVFERHLEDLVGERARADPGRGASGDRTAASW